MSLELIESRRQKVSRQSLALIGYLETKLSMDPHQFIVLVSIYEPLLTFSSEICFFIEGLIMADDDGQNMVFQH